MKVKDDVRCVYRPNKLIIYLSSGKLFELNKTGQIIFDLIKKGKKEKEITKELSKKYEKDYTTLLDDVKKLVAELKKNGILE